MGKYSHLNEDEIIAHIEKFGTKDERDILEKIHGEIDWELCPECERREVIFSKCYEKIEEAIGALNNAQTELE